LLLLLSIDLDLEGDAVMNTMLRRSGAGLAVLAVVLLLAACQSTTGRTLGENIDDAGITTTVKAKLAAEKIATLTRIDVDTNQGVVALNGTVQTESMKVRAEQIARQVKGVRDVINNLRVQAAAR
jgi:hyperosmotically inducible protein